MDHIKLDAALKLAARGYCVIPVHDCHTGQCSCKSGKACSSPGKHPRIQGWKDKASSELAVVRSWWARNPRANIGIATGRRYGVCVLDFDYRNGGRDALELLEAELGPDWITAGTIASRNSNHGLHVYFRCDHEAVTKANVLPGMDVRGNGGLIIGPGSIHASGESYRSGKAGFLPQHELPLMPPFLVQLTQERHKERRRNNTGITQEKPKASKGGGSVIKPTEAQKSMIADAIAGTIPTRPGRRHAGIFNLARRLRHVFGDECGTNILRPIVRLWHEQATASSERHGFDIRGTFPDSWDEFREAWKRVHTPSDGTEGTEALIATVSKQLAADEPMPATVADCLEELGYSEDALLRGLVLLLWSLSKHHSGNSFPCGARFAARSVNAAAGIDFTFQYYNRKLSLLMDDGVIERTAEGRRGAGSDCAAEYRWCWQENGGATLNAWDDERRLAVATAVAQRNQEKRQTQPARKLSKSEQQRPHLVPEFRSIRMLCRKHPTAYESDSAARRAALSDTEHRAVLRVGVSRIANATEYELQGCAADYFAALQQLSHEGSTPGQATECG